MGIIMVAIAPHFVNVQHGLRQVNDWNVHNCLGPKPWPRPPCKPRQFRRSVAMPSVADLCEASSHLQPLA